LERDGRKILFEEKDREQFSRTNKDKIPLNPAENIPGLGQFVDNPGQF